MGADERTKRVRERDEADAQRDLDEMVAGHEAGLNDLLNAYQVIERQYFSVASAPTRTVTYRTDTIRRG
jgi:hypothetical protein